MSRLSKRRRSWIAEIAEHNFPRYHDYSATGGDVYRRWCIDAMREVLKTAAKIARNPYSDEVQVFGGEEPLAVGQKIAKAIESMGKPAANGRKGKP